ncbi:MAG: formate dehydrogenase accessory sulfurtransferase FdhD [Myxococcota bacterium]
MGGVRHVRLSRTVDHVCYDAEDAVAIEEPLTIQLARSADLLHDESVLAVTMRTPGHDRELAVGYAYNEAIIEGPEDLLSVRERGPLDPASGARRSVLLELAPTVNVDWTGLNRHSVVNSSCGVCGKTLLDAAEIVPVSGKARFTRSALLSWADRARKAQGLFHRTGGIHAVALFDTESQLVAVREDVGRHNAMDKLTGAYMERVPWSDHGLLLSGRASFELLQKAARVGVPVVAAVGAPTSLAVETAQRAGITLVGFLRDRRFNIYTRSERIL